jgi:hypothetical protein
LYILVKRLFLLIDAYAALFVINFGAKVFQFEYIFKKLDNFENLICMVGFRIAFGLLMLLIYDLIKRDLFELEIKSPEKIKKLEEQDSFLKKIYNKAPWLKKLFQRMKNSIIQSKYYTNITNKKWFQEFIIYCKKAVWIKIITNIVIFIFVSLVDPVLEIIRSSPGKNKCKSILKLTILRNYIIGSLLCSIALYGTFSILHRVSLF